MKVIIKLIVALFFILCSYFIGYNQAEEKYSNQLKETNQKLVANQSNIKQLTDSVVALNILLKKNGLSEIKALADKANALQIQKIREIN